MAIYRKNIETPDEARTFAKGQMGVVKLDGLICGKGVFEPGWRWSEHVKPIAQTERCMVHHNGYVISGRMTMQLEDGTEIEVGPGDAFVCPPGHDAWVLGDEPCVALDFSGAAVYAKPAE